MDLIDREALLTDWDKKLNRLIPDEDGLHPISLETVIKALGDAPTASTVEVVRCEKCDSFDEFKDDNRGYCERHREVVYCTHYCGYGKCRDGE